MACGSRQGGWSCLAVRVVASLLAASIAACSISGPGRAPADDPAIGSAIAKGLACVSRSYDGNSFRDDYLQFRYPGEAVVSPLPGYRLTYRILDAYFIVLMLRQAGIAPGDAGTLFDRAEAVTAALVPAWRAKGIYNLRRNPARDGIALDTYAVLAVLRHDPEMGRVVEAGLDGDGWLPADFYVGEDRFRRLADESWAARALLVADRVKGIEVVDDICRQASRAIGSETDPLARANLVIHAMEAMGDLPPSADRTREDLLGPLRAEALRLLQVKEIRDDTLTLANLLGALIPDHSLPADSLSPYVVDLARRQGADGCWSVSTDPGDTSARVFATLRVVLTLGQYQTHPRAAA